MVRGNGKPADGPFGSFACLAPEGKGAGGRVQRVFDHGELRFVILHLISEKPRHGYDLIKAIGDKLSGMYSPSPGVIYPTLTQLEECGMIAAVSATGSKRLYALTESGDAFLSDQAHQLASVLARLDAASCFFKTPPSPEILRAMRVVAHALAVRLGRTPLEAGHTRAICDLLNRLATDIEHV